MPYPFDVQVYRELPLLPQVHGLDSIQHSQILLAGNTDVTIRYSNGYLPCDCISRLKRGSAPDVKSFTPTGSTTMDDHAVELLAPRMMCNGITGGRVYSREDKQLHGTSETRSSRGTTE